jgi:hypothetical protein
MIHLMLCFTGKDSELLARLLVFLQTLFGMDVFKTKISPHFSQEFLQGLFDNYSKKYEAGMFGDRNGIAQRKPARAAMVEAGKKVLTLLSAVASDEDIVVLQTAGVQLAKRTGIKGKKHVVVSPATDN